MRKFSLPILPILFGGLAIACGGAAPTVFLEGEPASPEDGGVSVDAGSDQDQVGPPVEAGVDAPLGSEAGVQPSCAPCLLSLDYFTMNVTPQTEQIQPSMEILNAGTAAQDLTSVTLRYWFTADGSQSQIASCDYAATSVGAAMALGCAYVSASFVPVVPATAMADTYMDVSFSGGFIPAGGTASIYMQFHDVNYATFTQTNDYSFTGAATALASWPRITVYVNGALVWGIEPN
jgi:hypothetical protein